MSKNKRFLALTIFSCTGETSWYQFSKYLLEKYRERYNDHRDYKLEAIKTSDLQLSAKRPKLWRFKLRQAC